MLLGWGLMFGGDNPFIGTEHLFVLGGADLGFYDDTLTSTVPFWGKFFFQLVFCGTAATIVSGAVAERIKYLSFISFPLCSRWSSTPSSGTGSGAAAGLADLGFMDFAGGRRRALGRRLGGSGRGADFGARASANMIKPASPRPSRGHNMSLAVIGLFVLWLGWFGFNPAPP